MSMGAHHVPRDAGTVPLHVQVIDTEPFALDMVVPTYIPAKDLTQRVARDAGLGAYWEDGSRRLYYLRARGRLLEEHEKLEDLGVVPHELVHLLPQPPEGSGLVERPPEYPPNRGYAGAGNVAVALSLGGVLLWTTAWAIAMTAMANPVVGFLPGLGLALLCTSFSRHLWGGEPNRIRIPMTGIMVYGPLTVLALIPSLLGGVTPTAMGMTLAGAVIGGLSGVTLGWLAWYGAVEPLPKVTRVEIKQGEELVTWPCGICGGPVTPDVKADCIYQCGRVFHAGCYQAKKALSVGNRCAVCGFEPQAA